MLSLHTCGHPKRRATPCLVHCRLLFGSGSRRHGRRYVHVPRMNTVLVYARRCDWRARNLAYTMLNRFTVRASWTKRRGRAVTSRLIEVAVRYRKASSAMMGALAREQTGAARRTREAARAAVMDGPARLLERRKRHARFRLPTLAKDVAESASSSPRSLSLLLRRRDSVVSARLRCVSDRTSPEGPA